MRDLFRWTGALVFGVSLLSFAAVYGWRLATPAPPSDDALRAAIANTLLFTMFALHHSIMARSGAKAWITRLVPADLERSVYVWIASVLFLAVCWMWQPLPGTIWVVAAGAGWLFHLAQAAGVVLTVASARIVGFRELAGIRQPDLSKPIEFKAQGPFAIVRHPIYLGWMLMVFGTPVMTTSRLLFAMVSSAYLIAAIPLEERSLLASHRNAYRTYQEQMRWRLVPFVW